MVFSYVEVMFLDHVINLTHFLGPVEEPFAGGVEAIQEIHSKRDHLRDTQHE